MTKRIFFIQTCYNALPNDTSTTPAPASPIPVPHYEFDVYRLGKLCTEDEAALGPEILGDALIVVAQVYNVLGWIGILSGNDFF